MTAPFQEQSLGFRMFMPIISTWHANIDNFRVSDQHCQDLPRDGKTLKDKSEVKGKTSGI